MTLKEADLDFKQIAGPLVEAQRRLKELKALASSEKGEDPVIAHVQSKTKLYEIVDLIDEEDQFMISLRGSNTRSSGSSKS